MSSPPDPLCPAIRNISNIAGKCLMRHADVTRKIVVPPGELREFSGNVIHAK
jgi:hypothetical protein